MKKILILSFGLFLLFSLLLYGYLFHWANTDIPKQLIGTASDPSTFMNQKELLLSKEYSTIKDFLFFVSTAWSALLLVIIITTKWTYKWELFSKSAVKNKFLQLTSYLFIFSLFTTFASLPIDYYGYKLSVSYGISVEQPSDWVRDEIINFWISFALSLVVIQVLYYMMQKSTKKWWLYTWLLSIPFTLFLTFIQPVLIDPIYNDFTPLQNKELETKIIEMAKKADIPANKVYQVNMSESTTSLNAYVTGIGKNSRIVLWDTTLEKLSDDEILFIMAHEMGHYVKKHVYINIATYLLLTLVGLYLCYKIMTRITTKHGEKMGIVNKQGFTMIPLLFLLSSLLGVVSDPLTNLQSRMHEVDCDKYALKMTGNTDAAIKTFQELSRIGLDDVHPPLIIKVWRNSHPSILERIEYIKNNE